MSDRIKTTWKVIRSIEQESGDYCVDFFFTEDGSFGYEEFRRDIDDQGRWTGVNHYSSLAFDSKERAMASALKNVTWLTTDALD